jgi:two-component system, sensor histidine kinase and response regulator
VIPPQEEETEAFDPGSGQSAAKILMVDDNLELLAVLKQILERQNYQVVTVSRVAQALESLIHETPDIIICDVMIPEKNGFDFHTEIQQHPVWCNIPFIFLTAMAGDKDIRVGKELGVDDYLTKPFNPDDLIAVVKGKLALAAHRKKMVDKQMDGYRRRIIHTLSHEFRTPLVSINTGSELLLDQQADLNQEQIARLLRSIWRGGQRLEKLVDDFMVLQQIDLGHAQHTSELYRQRIPFAQIVETAVESFPELYPDCGGVMPELIMPQEDELPLLVVCVYDIQLISVLHRLLHNAFKFGGVEKPVTVSIGKKSNRVYASIRDRGPGMENFPVSAALACQPFVQINRETYEQQGCGLGLTISMYFTQINGGTLILRVPDDRIGIEAVIDFPLVKS